MADFVVALDQGTTSTRCMVFDHNGIEIARHQVTHRQYFPHPGWVEHDAIEIFDRSQETLSGALKSAALRVDDLVGLGITNQRETVVVWDRSNGLPVAPAIVWQDTRTNGQIDELRQKGVEDFVAERTGLPLSTYASASKLQWILEHIEHVRLRADRGDVLFGTIDSWLIWKMTGVHVTDVSNASRTMLMNLHTCEWDPELLELFDIPRAMLPEITTCSLSPDRLVAEVLGGSLSITGIMGDQQAAMVGHGCLQVGDAKNTYGTGNFLLVNTGEQPIHSSHGLITTVCFQFEDGPVNYALEGSVAVTGSAIDWLRDQLGVIERVEDSETLAASVEDSEDLYFVPAFSGLFAPHWRSDARGVLVGMTRSHTRAHLARATLESIGFQSRDVVRAMESDVGSTIEELRVDGGITANDLCMQLQADILGVPVIRAEYPEATALGAAFAAGLGAQLWPNPQELPFATDEGTIFQPTWDESTREARTKRWDSAVQRTLNWLEPE